MARTLPYGFRPRAKLKSWKFLILKARRLDLGLSTAELYRRFAAHLAERDLPVPSRSTFFLWERPGGIMPKDPAVRHELAHLIGLTIDDLYR